MTVLKTPRLPFTQHGGLWQSAYHLVHPKVTEDDSDFEDCSTGSFQTQLYSWEVPFATPEEFRITKLGYTIDPECPPDELGCWDEGCSSEDYDCQDLDDPVNTKDGYGPEEPFECEPSLITNTYKCSTIGYEAADYYCKAKRGLKMKRSQEIEKRLFTGECNSCVSICESDTEILGEGCPQPVWAAMAMLEEALSCCNSEEPGMIHSPVSGMRNPDKYDIHSVDYGDGMGERNVLFTKNRGHILTSGCHDYACEGDEPLDENLCWLYGTSMVHLLYGDIVVNGKTMKDVTNREINLVEVTAEQMVSAYFNPCCNFAVLADLSACE